MSVLAKARQYERGFPRFVQDMFVPYQELGIDYIVSVLKGYAPKPADVTIPPGMQYNVYFPGHAIGMPPPLSDGAEAGGNNTLVVTVLLQPLQPPTLHASTR